MTSECLFKVDLFKQLDQFVPSKQRKRVQTRTREVTGQIHADFRENTSKINQLFFEMKQDVSREEHVKLLGNGTPPKPSNMYQDSALTPLVLCAQRGAHTPRCFGGSRS